MGTADPGNPGLAPGVSRTPRAATSSAASNNRRVAKCRTTIGGVSPVFTVIAPSTTWTTTKPVATYAALPGAYHSPLPTPHSLLPTPRRSHHVYAPSPATRIATSPAARRCPYSIHVGRSSGGGSPPLHSGQGSPQPGPEAFVAALAARQM